MVLFKAHLGSSSVIDTSFGDIAPEVTLAVDWEAVGYDSE